jgi:hypothetical protein
MDLAQLERKLIAAARATPANDRVPYAFEKSVMARLSGRPAPDGSDFWARALWRAAASCLAVAAVLGALTFLEPAGHSQDLTQDFENTVLAAVDLEAVN